MATGQGTYIASLTRALPTGHVMSAFDYAVRRIVYLFIAFILVMVPLVIIISGASTGRGPAIARDNPSPILLQIVYVQVVSFRAEHLACSMSPINQTITGLRIGHYVS